MRRCDQCGERRECRLSVDPFAAEMASEDEEEAAKLTESWWCDECWIQRRLDI
jgi:hypothetical protein